MSKLNIKVVDMENPVTETAKKVTHRLSNFLNEYSQSTRLLRTIVRSASSQTKSRRTLTKSTVSFYLAYITVYHPLEVFKQYPSKKCP